MIRSKDMVSWKHQVVLIVLFAALGKCETVNLTYKSSIVEVNDSVVFRCSYNVPMPLIQWFRNDKTVGFWYNGKETFNSSEYIHDISNGLSTLTKRTVTTNDHNTWWRCDVTSAKSNILQVFVYVPVSEVLLKLDGIVSSRVLMVENFGTTFTCKSSASYPVSSITWFKTLSGNNKKQDIELSQNTTVNVSDADESGYLVSVIGRLTYFPTKRDNGWRIYCKASNINGRSVTSNETTHLYVQYSPTLPTFYVNQMNVSVVITIITGNMLRVTCISSGYPAPSLTWAHASTTISYNQTLNIPSVNETNAGNYTCKAENVLTLTNLTELKKGTKNTLSVEVLIPPAIPKLYFGNSDDGHELSTYSLNVIRNQSFTVKCTATGVPTPICRWGEMRNNTLTVAFADKYSYRTCSASSLLEETVGENKIYSRNATLSVNVLYPPDVLSIGNHKAVEGGFFRITCSHKTGNPKKTFFKWTSDSISIFTKELFIQNVSKLHDRYYNCTAYNKMQPTVGRQENGTSTKAFHLTVLYKATVNKFVIEDREDASPAFVNETESVIFSCHFESNPSPNITLNFKENTLKRVSLSKTLVYNHTFRSCLGAGDYTCYGENKYNNKMPSFKTLAVKVKCTPMSSIKLPLLLRIASRQNVSKTLNFTALAFPEPGPEGFIWHKFVNDTWLQLANDKDFRIVSSVLDSNLTIRNVSLSGYRMYKLVIKNSFGEMEQNYTLVPEDIPSRPKIFSYFEESLTETNVTVTWVKGFNGGFQQTFTLKYNKTSLHDFRIISINETDEAIMNYTITDLETGKTYQLKLSTRNKIGENNESHVIYIRTTDRKTESIMTESQVQVVPIALSVAGGMLLITGIILGSFIYKKRLNQTNGQNLRKETGTAYQTEFSRTYDDLDVNKREGNTYSQLPAAYEQLDNVTKDGNTYMEMENTNVKREDPDYINIRI